MISLTNHDFQWGRSEVVIIYPDPFFEIGNPPGLVSFSKAFASAQGRGVTEEVLATVFGACQGTINGSVNTFL